LNVSRLLRWAILPRKYLSNLLRLTNYQFMSQKVLFLDFDGVLHPTYSGSPKFTQLPILESVLTKQPCKIVISSSWRFHMSNEKLRSHLSLPLQSMIIGTTGNAQITPHARFEEIKAFVDSHQIVDWKALDDSYWEFPSVCINLIRCNPNTGITQVEALQLRTWLTNTSS